MSKSEWFLDADGYLLPELEADNLANQYGAATLLQSEDDNATEWLIPGLVFAGRNMLIGRSMAGKSFLATAIADALAHGKHFLGEAVAIQGVKTLIVSSDAGEVSQYRRRFTELGTDPANIFLAELNNYSPVDRWQELGSLVNDAGIGLVIVDNARGLLDPALEESSNRPWTELWNNRIAHLEATGAAVILIHHASEKGSKHLAMDSSAAVQLVRQVISVATVGSDPNRRIIRTTPNIGEPKEWTATVNFEECSFTVRTREPDTLDRNAEIARLAVASAGSTVQEIADDIASRMPELSASTLRKNKLPALVKADLLQKVPGGYALGEKLHG